MFVSKGGRFFLFLIALSFLSFSFQACEDTNIKQVAKRYKWKLKKEKKMREQRVVLYDMASKVFLKILASDFDYWESNLDAVYAYPEFINDDLQLYVSHIRSVAQGLVRNEKLKKRGEKKLLYIHPELPVREWFVTEVTLLAYIGEVRLGIKERTLKNWEYVLGNVYVYPEHITEKVKWAVAQAEKEGKQWDAEREKKSKKKNMNKRTS